MHIQHKFLKFGILILLPLVQLNIGLCWKKKMKDIIIHKKAKSSTANPNEVNLLPGDKNLGIDPLIHFYEVEGGDKTEEGK